MYVLFEHASGYAIFRCSETEDIGALLPEVQEAVMDFGRFSSMVTLEAFSPFKTGANALENINSVSEGKRNIKLPKEARGHAVCTCICGMVLNITK